MNISITHKKHSKNLSTILSKSLTQIKGMVVFETIGDRRTIDIQSRTEFFNQERIKRGEKKRKENSGYQRFTQTEKINSEGKSHEEQRTEGSQLSNLGFASPLFHLPGVSSPSFLFHQGKECTRMIILIQLMQQSIPTPAWAQMWEPTCKCVPITQRTAVNQNYLVFGVECCPPFKGKFIS